MTSGAIGRQRERAFVCVALSAACVLGCSDPQMSIGSVASATLPHHANPASATAAVARRQNWNCRRIEREIADLVAPMRTAMSRAEEEEARMPQTLARTVARLSGPPGAGNAAFADFTELRNDADRLNDLLKEKKCAGYVIDVGLPAFVHP